MRKNLLVGLVLAVAAVVVVFVSDWFGLELESVALLGVAIGAVIAVVPDRSPFMRLAAFVAGALVTLICYLLRAGALPDSTAGFAVFAGLTIALVTVVSVGSGGRLSLWATLLGAAAFAGAFDQTYTAAPPEVVSTSVSALTALFMTVAFGFFAVLAAVLDPAASPAQRAPRTEESPEETHRLDDMMETK
jgi:hypothetical protein